MLQNSTVSVMMWVIASIPAIGALAFCRRTDLLACASLHALSPITSPIRVSLENE
jgi:hypothetical protein